MTWTKFELDLYFLVNNLHMKNQIYMSILSKVRAETESSSFFSNQIQNQPVYLYYTFIYKIFEFINKCNNKDRKVNFPFFFSRGIIRTGTKIELNLYISKTHLQVNIKSELNVCNGCWDTGRKVNDFEMTDCLQHTISGIQPSRFVYSVNQGAS